MQCVLTYSVRLSTLEREDERPASYAVVISKCYLTWKVKAEIKREVKQEDSYCEHVYNV